MLAYSAAAYGTFGAMSGVVGVAGVVYASASARMRSFGEYTRSMSPVCSKPVIACSVIARLWCDPPVSQNTPSATCCALTVTAVGRAFRTLAGTAMSAGGFAVADVR
jgi:hypothetical protein